MNHQIPSNYHFDSTPQTEKSTDRKSKKDKIEKEKEACFMCELKHESWTKVTPRFFTVVLDAKIKAIQMNYQDKPSISEMLMYLSLAAATQESLRPWSSRHACSPAS